jgi:chromosome segregation ATPase
VAESETQTPDAEIAVTPAELRAPKLPLQSLGGYSRADTDRLLDRAAKALDEAHQRLAEEARRRTASVEQTVGEVLVTAHHAAESVRHEAQQQADAVLVAARASAQELVEKAEREAQEIEAAKARVEEALAEEHEKARASREDVEREIAVLQADARRVRSAIDEFRDQWLNLMSETLRQLELRFPNAEAAADEIETLHDDLRSRLTTVESAPAPGKSSPDKAS